MENLPRMREKSPRVREKLTEKQNASKAVNTQKILWKKIEKNKYKNQSYTFRTFQKQN